MERLSKGPVYEHCQAALDEHIRRYFVERDIQATLAQYHENAVGLGTGRGEAAMEADALRAIIRKDLGSYPYPVTTRIKNIKNRELYQVTPEVVISQMLIDFSITSNTHRITLKDARHNLVWYLPADEEPRICHVHVSHPTTLHGEEEAYPLKELEEVSQMVDELINDRTQSLTESYRRLEQMVVRDRLTGMFNRVRIDQVLEQELVRASRYHRHFSVIFLDLDHFKQINDSYGHLMGDKILKSLAYHIESNSRETDTAARWGGEEFLIFWVMEARHLAEKLRKAFESHAFKVNDQEIRLTLSLGVASYQEGSDIDAILDRADKALYRAKANGRNRTELCDGGISSR